MFFVDSATFVYDDGYSSMSFTLTSIFFLIKFFIHKYMFLCQNLKATVLFGNLTDYVTMTKFNFPRLYNISLWVQETDQTFLFQVNVISNTTFTPSYPFQIGGNPSPNLLSKFFSTVLELYLIVLILIFFKFINNFLIMIFKF